MSTSITLNTSSKQFTSTLSSGTLTWSEEGRQFCPSWFLLQFDSSTPGEATWINWSCWGYADLDASEFQKSDMLPVPTACTPSRACSSTPQSNISILLQPHSFTPNRIKTTISFVSVQFRILLSNHFSVKRMESLLVFRAMWILIRDYGSVLCKNNTHRKPFWRPFSVQRPTMLSIWVVQPCSWKTFKHEFKHKPKFLHYRNNYQEKCAWGTVSFQSQCTARTHSHQC